MIGRLLIWLSGANERVLAECPTERPKFIGIGGAVMTTSVAAFLSSSVALWSYVKLPLPAALTVGLLWGFAIMNIDRWLVSSTKRQKSWFLTLVLAIPRILMALVIGLVIAEPLTLRVFATEVNEQATKVHTQRVDELYKEEVESYDAKGAKRVLDQLKQQQRASQTAAVSDPEVVAAEQKVTEAGTRCRDAKNNAALEIYGNGGGTRSGVAGDGPAAQLAKEAADSACADVQRAQAALDELRGTKLLQGIDGAEQLDAEIAEQTIRFERAQRQTDLAARERDESAADDPGLLDSLEAQGQLTEKSSTLNIAVWLLRAFILLIDLLPVLVKTLMMLGKPTLYDEALERYEQRLLDEIQLKMDAEVAVAQAETAIPVNEAVARRELEQQAAREVSERVVEVQRELALKYVERWGEQASEWMDQQAAMAFVAPEADSSTGSKEAEEPPEESAAAGPRGRVQVRAMPANGPVPLKVKFVAATESERNQQPPIHVRWEFGDGSVTDGGSAVDHSYLTPGTFTVRATVTWADGTTTTSATKINVGVPSATDSPPTRPSAAQASTQPPPARPAAATRPPAVFGKGNGTGPSGNGNSPESPDSTPPPLFTNWSDPDDSE